MADGEDFVHVIPPGEERHLTDLLGGSDRIAGCAVDSATVERTSVRVHYLCGTDPAIDIELHHPSDGANALATTERFAIVPRGTVPAAFGEALVARIRERESAFHWISAEAPGLGVPSDAPSTVPSDTSALSPEQSERYLQGVRLIRANRNREAFDIFYPLSREVPGHGVLGMLVSTVATSLADRASVDRLTQVADANPADTLAQFVAGVSVHYHGHHDGRSLAEKRAAYARAITYLNRTLPTYSFEPRVFLYLAISHFRLGHQAEAQRLIEQAIPLATNDPDVFYCRGEIYQRVDVHRAIGDIQHYLEMVDQLHRQGVPINQAKHQRVQRMLASLQAVAHGTATLPPDDALFDPIESGEHGTGRQSASLARPFTASRSFALIALAVAALGSVAFWRFGRKSRI